MAFVERSNNRVLPNNSRQVDVAKRAIEEITPVQQQKYLNAFRVQGFQVVHYVRCTNGPKCTCMAERKVLNTILNTDGKASVGTINDMLLGTHFGVSRYGSASLQSEGYGPDGNNDTPEKAARNDLPIYDIVSPHAPVNPHQGVFDNVYRNEKFPNADIDNVDEFDSTYGDNGPLRDEDLDTLVGDWDASGIGFTDTGCPVCFGTGHVGGFVPFYGHRVVLTPDQVENSVDSEIQTVNKPWTVIGSGFIKQMWLPRGAIALDTATLWNRTRRVPYEIVINGTVLQNVQQILDFCTGQFYTIEIRTKPDMEWSHFELQFNLNTESAYFEFPKLSSSSDLSLLELTEPFQIIISPNVPQVQPMDVITDSVYGKAMIVQNSNLWQTRSSKIHGWEATVRVLQPQETLNLLPRRGRTPTKTQTTRPVIDNRTGPRRT